MTTRVAPLGRLAHRTVAAGAARWPCRRQNCDADDRRPDLGVTSAFALWGASVCGLGIDVAAGLLTARAATALRSACYGWTSVRTWLILGA